MKTKIKRYTPVLAAVYLVGCLGLSSCFMPDSKSTTEGAASNYRELDLLYSTLSCMTFEGLIDEAQRQFFLDRLYSAEHYVDQAVVMKLADPSSVGAPAAIDPMKEAEKIIVEVKYELLEIEGDC